MTERQHDRPADASVGRRLTWVWLLVAVLFLALAGLTAAVRTTPLPPDSTALDWALDHRVPWLTTIAVAVTTTGSGLPAYVLAAVAGLVARPARWWTGVALAELALLAGEGVRVVLAAWRQRPRPPTDLWLTGASGYSFPSGHTTTSALVAALLCAALARRFVGRARLVLQLLCLVWAAAVGLTRVYLAVHWATDVTGGWLLAAGLSLLAYALVRNDRQRGMTLWTWRA